MKQYVKFILTLVLGLAVMGAQGQKRQIKKATSAYEDQEYQDVIENLDKAKEKGASLSDELLMMYGDAFFFQNKKSNAFDAYSKTQPASMTAEVLVRYGKLLQAKQNYGKAFDMFKRAIAKGNNSPHVKLLRDAADWARSAPAPLDGVEISKASLEINGPSAGVQFYKDGLVFSKAPEQEEARRDEKGYNYTDMYYVPYTDGEFGKERVFSTALKFPFSAGATSFSADEQHLYFTKVTKGKGGKSITKILRADYGKDDWHEDVKTVKFNSNTYSCAMPALSVDGSFMVFVSDMPGGQGGKDLYITFREGTAWAKPRNLGPIINTAGDEVFPYVNADGDLYFASDGHLGFGGLDIFKAHKNENSWENVENMKMPINSGRDDFAFVQNPYDPFEAFISSNRQGSGRYDAIYHVTLPLPEDEGDFLEPTSDEQEDDLDAFLEGVDEGSSDDEGSGETGDELDAFLEDDMSVEDTGNTGSSGSLQEAMQSSLQEGDNLIYRVQFLSTIEPRDKLKTFKPTGDYVFRYKYKGLYRYTIGEFYTTGPAIELLNKVKNLGYKDAFIAAFRNNERVLDVTIFKNDKEKEKRQEEAN